MLEKYYKILEDIKTLKIQGATNVTIFGLKAILFASEEIKDLSFLKQLGLRILKIRPTEPLFKNALKNVFSSTESVEELKEKINYTISLIYSMKKTTEDILAKKIPDNCVIFTHCHSSTVTKGIIKAYLSGKNIKVINTETRPKFQGRITAKELSKHGIPVTHIVDSAMAEFLKKADIVLIGADAITSEGYIVNKIGSLNLSILANLYEIPIYSCTISWKFDYDTSLGDLIQIETRNPSEVWENPPKNIKIKNIAFSKVPPKNITGIISEMGILAPEVFIEEFKGRYKEIIKYKL